MKVALVFGGRSGEHNVSVVSARSVATALSERHTVVPMAIDRQGRWATDEGSRKVLDGSGDRADLVLPFAGVNRLNPGLLDGNFDVAFPVLHGPFGEDGTIQGLFEMLDLPYVGCGVAASALCMDKIRTKRVLASEGLSTAPSVAVSERSWQTDRDVLRLRALGLGLPLFVKPSRMGSSVGITKVSGGEELDAAVELALQHDDDVLIEQGLEAREIEVAVLGNGDLKASVPGEIVPGGDFYSFADKYLDDSCQLLAPAPLNPSDTTRVQELAKTAFSILGCQGMARVDLFLEKVTGRFWINEVNTIPGFTSISMYPKLWGLSGLAYPDLLDELIDLAIQRHQTRRRNG